MKIYARASKNIPDYIKDAYITGLMRKSVPKELENKRILGVSRLGGDWYNAFEKDIAVANFYFSESTTLEYMRSENMKVIDFISQIGGLFGLCIGFSAVSIIELLYWLSIRLCQNLIARKGGFTLKE